MHDTPNAVTNWLAREEIADLQRRYAVATDLIGTGDPDKIERGRAIYHSIFTPDARLGAAGVPDVTGPDAWADLVRDALADYEATQHLIGTQVVELESLPAEDGSGGRAHLSSYLQAWHAKPDGELWLFLGTYEDDVVSTPDGWRIASMRLDRTSGERRTIHD